ncbi:nucleoside diphosphate-linked moiety X motif 17 isoform X2 [Protopterus annectens]|uniref:nucleoside diphosphate-linked moiety X motif 17 isoform X2 n=1 Tax=Protopterus annectens TaxID=7888 RepID=UPI001CFB6D54|nr:nucleoside diphosphate-linked moiety X motif 17 isoform X2 [Protopterus annectens]
MEGFKKVLVYLSKDNSIPQCAKFAQSITGHFCGSHEDRVPVNFCLSNNKFIVSDNEFQGSTRAFLKRPPFCPFKHLDATQLSLLREGTQSRGVDTGVAILLQTANKKILLTRRAKDLSIFPNLWVPPGGHVELNEKLLTAGLRELEEETGLHLKEGGYSSMTLGLWESAYPPGLSRGLPKRHHIVSYLVVTSNEDHSELQDYNIVRRTDEGHRAADFGFVEHR